MLAVGRPVPPFSAFGLLGDHGRYTAGKRKAREKKSRAPGSGLLKSGSVAANYVAGHDRRVQVPGRLGDQPKLLLLRRLRRLASAARIDDGRHDGDYVSWFSHFPAPGRQMIQDKPWELPH